MTNPGKMMAAHRVAHRVILVLLSVGGQTTNAGHYWGTLTGIREAVCCNRPELLSEGVLL
jgi:hypothetical protein